MLFVVCVCFDLFCLLLSSALTCSFCQVPELLFAVLDGKHDFAIGTRYAGAELSVDANWCVQSKEQRKRFWLFLVCHVFEQAAASSGDQRGRAAAGAAAFAALRSHDGLLRPLRRRLGARTRARLARWIQGRWCSSFFLVFSLFFLVFVCQICLESYIKCGVSGSRLAEVPILFGTRTYGESKLTGKVIVSYLQHLLELYYYKFAHLIVLLFLVLLLLAYVFFKK
jgi:hypothetical protein